MHNKIIFVTFLVSLFFILGCQPLDKDPPALPLTIEWDVPSPQPAVFNDFISVGLKMRYSGQQEFQGEYTITDNANLAQYGGFDTFIQEFSSAAFYPGFVQPHINEFQTLNRNPLFATYQKGPGELKQVQFDASVRIEKQEDVVSSDKFCIPTNLNTPRSSCRLQDTIAFPESSAAKSMNIRLFGSESLGNQVEIDFSLNERCDIITPEAVYAKNEVSDKYKLSLDNIQVSLSQTGTPLTCQFLPGTAKNQKTLKCRGTLSTVDQFDEGVHLRTHYGCEYKIPSYILKFIQFEDEKEDVLA